MTNSPAHQMKRRNPPTGFIPPRDCECIDCLRTRIQISTVKSLQLRIMTRCKAIYRVRAKLAIRISKSRWIQPPIIEIDNVTNIVCSIIEASRNPSHLQPNTMLPTDFKYAHCPILKMRLPTTCLHNCRRHSGYLKTTLPHGLLTC